MYKITNVGKGPRFVHDVRGSYVEIPPRTIKEVMASKYTARLIKRCQLNGDTLHVDSIDEGDDSLDNVTLKKPSAPVHQEDKSDLKDMRIIEEKPIEEVIVSEIPTPAQDLLSRLPKINLQQFRSEAKEILGDKWPGGVPNRDEIVSLLRA